MRKPSATADLLAWHRRALAGEKPAVTHEAHVGWFKRRMIRGGPWVPVVIWMHQPVDDDGELIEPERLRCMVGHKEEDAEEQWTYGCAHPIAESEYGFLMADREWAFSHAPADPVAHPDRPIDFNKLPPPF